MVYFDFKKKITITFYFSFVIKSFNKRLIWLCSIFECPQPAYLQAGVIVIKKNATKLKIKKW